MARGATRRQVGIERRRPALKITRALLSALALLALLAVPAFAQSGSFTVTIECGAPESITVDNNTDGTLVLEGVNSSENQEGDPEIDLGGEEVAAGASVTINFGDVSGSGNIFNNDLDETATVMISGEQYELTCEMGGTAAETFQINGTTPTPEPTEAPNPTEVVEVTATPENTPTVKETAEPTVEPTVDDGQHEDEQTEDEQSEDMPEEMPETGTGGLAAGVPLGAVLAGFSLLAGAAYAGIRRRR